MMKRMKVWTDRMMMGAIMVEIVWMDVEMMMMLMTKEDDMDQRRLDIKMLPSTKSVYLR